MSQLQAFPNTYFSGEPFWRAIFQQLSLVVISRGSNRNGQPTTRGAISSQLQWQKGNMYSPCHCRPDIRPWVINLHVSRATTHCQSVWSCLIQWDFALQKLHVPWSRVGFSTHGTTSILETSGCPLPGTACWSFGQCQKGLLCKKQRAQFPAWDGMTIADMGVREKNLNPNRHFLMIEYLEEIWRYIEIWLWSDHGWDFGLPCPIVRPHMLRSFAKGTGMWCRAASSLQMEPSLSFPKIFEVYSRSILTYLRSFIIFIMNDIIWYHMISLYFGHPRPKLDWWRHCAAFLRESLAIVEALR